MRWLVMTVHVAVFDRVVRMIVQRCIVAVHHDIDLGAGQATTADFTHLEMRTDVECRGGVFK